MKLKTGVSVSCAPVLWLTQPAGRLAALQQAGQISFLAAVRWANGLGQQAVASLPENTWAWERGLKWMAAAYAPGGGLRVISLIMTATIYGLVGSAWEQRRELAGEENRPAKRIAHPA